MTITYLIQELIDKGGAIVSSNDCSEMEIADARATGRFAVDGEGLGFVLRYKEWLGKTARDHARMEFLEQLRDECEGHILTRCFIPGPETLRENIDTLMAGRS